MIEAERYMSMGGRHVMTSFVDMVWAITSKMLKAQSYIYICMQSKYRKLKSTSILSLVPTVACTDASMGEKGGARRISRTILE